MIVTESKIRGLYQVSFPTPRELCKAFVRFEEHYESPNPEFRYRPFSLAEFKRWYRTTKQHGKFSYYSYWGGFNIPGNILRPFYNGGFKRLSRYELDILGRFAHIRDLNSIYIIGTASQNGHEALKHETAHGLFYLDRAYRLQVLDLLHRNDSKLALLKKHLIGLGYCNKVLTDECHAYLLTNKEYLAKEKVEIPGAARLRRKLEAMYQESIARRSL